MLLLFDCFKFISEVILSYVGDYIYIYIFDSMLGIIFDLHALLVFMRCLYRSDSIIQTI